MSTHSRILRVREGGGLTFWCPGCNMAHGIQHGAGPGPRWGWNGDMDRPTFTPSVLVRWSEPSNAPEEFDNPAKDVKKVCHSFVTDGRIQFLSDSTHALAGQTVDIPDYRRAEP